MTTMKDEMGEKKDGPDEHPLLTWAVWEVEVKA